MILLKCAKRCRVGARTMGVLTLILCAIMLTNALAQARQTRFFGRLTSGEGNAIPNATIVLCNANAKLWFITSTDATGSFEFTQLPANQFSVEVLSPHWRRRTRNPAQDQIWGFSPWADSLTVQVGQNVQRNIQLGGLVQQPRLSQTSPPCTPRRSRLVLSAEALSTLLVRQTPVLTTAGPASITEAELTLEAFLNNEGKVISLRLLSPSWPPEIDPVLMRAAVEAVRDWQYRPPQPVGSHQEVFEFGGPITIKSRLVP